MREPIARLITWTIAATLFAVCPGLQAQSVGHGDWRTLISETRADDTIEILNRVNRRINEFKRVSDRQLWRQEDYWATPLELYARGAGDCEDFAIAKYYLLRAHGIPASRLRLMFAKVFNTASGNIEPHLVLLYQSDDDNVPRVLDNLRTDIVPLSYRRDLIPVAAFDARRYWFYDGVFKPAAITADDVKPWQQLRVRWRRQSAGEWLAVASPVKP